MSLHSVSTCEGEVECREGTRIAVAGGEGCEGLREVPRAALPRGLASGVVVRMGRGGCPMSSQRWLVLVAGWAIYSDETWNPKQ